MCERAYLKSCETSSLRELGYVARHGPKLYSHTFSDYFTYVYDESHSYRVTYNGQCNYRGRLAFMSGRDAGRHGTRGDTAATAANAQVGSSRDGVRKTARQRQSAKAVVSLCCPCVTQPPESQLKA